MDWLPIVLALIASIPGVLALVREFRFGRPDALKKYEELTNDLVGRVQTLERQTREQEIELTELRGGVVLLIAQLEANGMAPVWRPKDKKAKAVT